LPAVLLLLAGLMLVVVGVTIIAGRRQARRVMTARERLQADLAGTDIRRISGARCLGHQGTGGGVQGIRGVGALGLTGTQLRFVLSESDRTITVPLTRVVGASLSRSFRGSRLGLFHRRPVLVVQWISDAGGRHEVGWTLPEATVWSSTIDQLVGR
jgi:hypothetical protein